MTITTTHRTSIIVIPRVESARDVWLGRIGPLIRAIKGARGCMILNSAGDVPLAQGDLSEIKNWWRGNVCVGTIGSMDWTNRFAARTACMKRSAIRELLKFGNRPGMISFA